jgi:carbonic anhydrase
MRLTLIVALVTGLSLAFVPMVDGEHSSNAFAPSPATPQAAIDALLAGNARYVAGKAVSHNPPAARSGLAEGQAPFAGIIRCADSRVAPEIVFDQALGELFVCAVAGNIPTPEIIASLEYGVAVLGTKIIVVMGHSSCGAVGAALEHRDDTSGLPGSLPMLIDQIVSPCALSVDLNDPNALDIAIACNAHQGIGELIKRSPVIKEAVAKGDLKIIAGVQNLKTGKFSIVQK